VSRIRFEKGFGEIHLLDSACVGSYVNLFEWSTRSRLEI
jgi:hypothetical protein